MRIGISNLAWDVSEDARMATLFQALRVDAIDVAPAKYFPRLHEATDSQIAQVRSAWQAKGIEITGMQALMFGTSGLNLFGPAQVQEDMLRHLEAVCRIGEGLGARRLVFGSPKNRDRMDLAPQQACDIAAAFFRRLGEIAQSRGVVICLEPNPPRYGANFMTTSQETAQVVRQTAHLCIRMQLDTGAMTVCGEDPAQVLAEHGELIGHIHAAEPDLLPLGDGGTDHARAAAAIAKFLPGHLVMIETLATRDEPHESAVARSLQTAITHYRDAVMQPAP